VVDVLEVQSPGQSDAFMKAKIEAIKKLLGDQKGNVTWKPPDAGAVRLP
jgi:hypothetical protein